MTYTMYHESFMTPETKKIKRIYLYSPADLALDQSDPCLKC